ncbi:MAG TPA: HesA/MoeB/ThiF family protein [Nitrospirae bacterium]|nr:HesA/MoeB/ThiF family protein [Nitrospirota bacterium]HDZ03398.1 HesA/MoeB/ThiF family protein [Nitrospirota bacterium]
MRWLSENFELTDTETERYRRQMMQHGFTVEHQKRLKGSTALIAGIGGLGGTAALYLAVAGIGKMLFVHSGKLTLSNMNRQILMKHEWIGKSRVIQAKKTIEGINLDVEVEIYDEKISEDNIERLLDGVQIALSARPNFHERRVLNHACVNKNIPMIEAAMNDMEGYLFNVIPKVTPCLNCIYPDDNPEWEELGFPVLGAVSGTLGCLMSIEAVKLLTGYGRPLLSCMLVFNTMSMEFKKLRINRDPGCKVCGSKN